MAPSNAEHSFKYVDTSRRQISANFVAATADYHHRLGAMMYDGVEFAKRSYDFKNDPKIDPRFTQSFSELNAVAFLFVTAGFERANLHSAKPPHPDVRAELANGSTVFVEVAEVIESPSAWLQGTLTYINVGIVKALDDEPSLRKKLNGHFINVRAWMPKSGVYDPHGTLLEFLRFLRTIDLGHLTARELVPFDESYSLLQSLAATYYYDRVPADLVPAFNTAAHSFSPESLGDQVIRVLRDKRAKAASYKGSPLWLALYISDMLGSSELSLRTLKQARVDFSPFVKLLVGDQRRVLVYSAT